MIGVVARPGRGRVGFCSGGIQRNCGANVEHIGKTFGTRHVSVTAVSRTQLTPIMSQTSPEIVYGGMTSVGQC